MAKTDLVADTITRIRNGQMVNRSFVVTHSSKFIISIMEVLKEEGYIKEFKVFEERKGVKFIKIDLKYHKGSPVIKEIKKISKQGRRVYSSVGSMPRFYGGLGVSVISTSKGLMSDHKARDLGIGGEIICNVY